MKNKYEIINDYVVIHMKNRKGEKFEAQVDLDDLDKLLKFDISWHAVYIKKANLYYVMATEYIGLDSEGNSINKTHYLHKFIMDKNLKGHKVTIDHKNNDTFNNRRNNLRLTSHTNNEKNRNGANKNNKTGHRNICIVGNRLYVQMQIDGVNTKLASFKFNEMNKAIEFAEKMRQKYYGEFAGKG